MAIGDRNPSDTFKSRNFLQYWVILLSFCLKYDELIQLKHVVTRQNSFLQLSSADVNHEEVQHVALILVHTVNQLQVAQEQDLDPAQGQGLVLLFTPQLPTHSLVPHPLPQKTTCLPPHYLPPYHPDSYAGQAQPSQLTWFQEWWLQRVAGLAQGCIRIVPPMCRSAHLFQFSISSKHSWTPAQGGIYGTFGLLSVQECYFISFYFYLERVREGHIKVY